MKTIEDFVGSTLSEALSKLPKSTSVVLKKNRTTGVLYGFNINGDYISVPEGHQSKTPDLKAIGAMVISQHKQRERSFYLEVAKSTTDLLTEMA